MVVNTGSRGEEVECGSESCEVGNVKRVGERTQLLTLYILSISLVVQATGQRGPYPDQQKHRQSELTGTLQSAVLLDETIITGDRQTDVVCFQNETRSWDPSRR